MAKREKIFYKKIRVGLMQKRRRGGNEIGDGGNPREILDGGRGLTMDFKTSTFRYDSYGLSDTFS